MTNREQFIHYIKTGEGKFICSPQIGAGSGFDTKVSGKTWFSQTTYEDTKYTCEQFDMIPLYNFGLPDLTQLTPHIHWERQPVKISETGRRSYRSDFVTPAGRLYNTTVEDELKGSCQTKYLITDEDELDILEYYLDRLLEVEDFSVITTQVAQMRKIVGDNALDVQWAMQPYSWLCLASGKSRRIRRISCSCLTVAGACFWLSSIFSTPSRVAIYLAYPPTDFPTEPGFMYLNFDTNLGIGYRFCRS